MIFQTCKVEEMNDFGMDADSNSWGSDYGEDFGSDISDGEYQPNGAATASSSAQHHQASSTAASRVATKTKGGAQARKMVNRGRWTKDEVSLPPPPTTYSFNFQPQVL